MQSIRYLCRDCRKYLKVNGFYAENKVGRKCCDYCGSNYDDLEVFSMEEYNQAVKKFEE